MAALVGEHRIEDFTGKKLSQAKTGRMGIFVEANSCFGMVRAIFREGGRSRKWKFKSRWVLHASVFNVVVDSWQKRSLDRTGCQMSKLRGGHEIEQTNNRYLLFLFRFGSIVVSPFSSDGCDQQTRSLCPLLCMDMLGNVCDLEANLTDKTQSLEQTEKLKSFATGMKDEASTVHR